jgi:hypothetical protein
MRWRRGLFRVWICLSVVWTATGLILLIDQQRRITIGLEAHDLAPFGWPAWWLKEELPLVFAPWILTAIGFGLRWIIRGFRAS